MPWDERQRARSIRYLVNFLPGTRYDAISSIAANSYRGQIAVPSILRTSYWDLDWFLPSKTGQQFALQGSINHLGGFRGKPWRRYEHQNKAIIAAAANGHRVVGGSLFSEPAGRYSQTLIILCTVVVCPQNGTSVVQKSIKSRVRLQRKESYGAAAQDGWSPCMCVRFWAHAAHRWLIRAYVAPRSRQPLFFRSWSRGPYLLIEKSIYCSQQQY